MKLSGIVHYMMPYCTFYFNFLSALFWGFSEQNKNFAITTYGGGGPISNPLLLLDRWTEFHENFRNCLLHDAILHLLFLIFIRLILGFPRAKQGLCHYDIRGGPISNPPLLLDRWAEFHETFRNCSLHDVRLHLLFWIFICMILGFPRAKQGLCHYDIWGGGTHL